jgi:hypothetical protein
MSVVVEIIPIIPSILVILVIPIMLSIPCITQIGINGVTHLNANHKGANRNIFLASIFFWLIFTA